MKKFLFLTMFISIFVLLGLIRTPINQFSEATTDYTTGYTNKKTSITFDVSEGATLRRVSQIMYIVSDDDGLSKITVERIDPDSISSTSTVKCYGATLFNRYLLTSGTLGQYTYIVTATDLLGRSTSKTLTVNVVAPTEPSLALTYTVKQDENNTSMAHIDGLGKYVPGEEVVLVAKPVLEGYTFFNKWQISFSGVNYISENVVTFKMPEKNVTVSAKYLPPITYLFSRSYLDNSSNTTYSVDSSRHQEGDHISVRAKNWDNLTFTHWEVSGLKLPDSALKERELEFDMPSNDVSISPRYLKNIVDINVKYDADLGSVSSPSTCKNGDTITLTATPASGCHFEGWSILGYYPKDTYSPTIKITPTTDLYVTAKFAKGTSCIFATITSGKGKVTVNGNKNLLSYYGGSYASITATPNENWEFDHWEQTLGDRIPGFDYSKASQEFIIPNHSVLLKAVFKQVEYTVTFKAENGSTLPSGKNTYEIGEFVSIKATPDPGYYFSTWKSNIDLADPSSATTSFTMPAKNGATIEAVFVSDCKVSISSKGPGSVYIEDGGNKYTRNKKFDVGETVTVIAEPNKDHIFLGWFDEDENKCSTSETYTFKMPSHKVSLKAHFSKREYKVKVYESFDYQGGFLSGEGTYEVGEQVYVYAIPSIGYEFDGWEKSTGLPYTPTLNTVAFEMPPNDVTLVAKFKWVGGY